jgi:sensor domain DACNV-containing protein
VTGGPSYSPARLVAQRLQAIFAANSALDPGVCLPETGAVEEVIGAAFWASLRREEGREPRISLALLPPERTPRPLVFQARLPLDPAVLAKVAPAVERPGIHLGVWRFDGALWVWGMTREVPMLSFVLEVVAPGLLVVKTRRRPPSTKFANIAVLEGSDVKFVDHHGAAALDAPPALRPLSAFYVSAGLEESDNVFVQLAISMRAQAKGGIVLVVPDGDAAWRASVVQPINYVASPAFAEIAALLERGDDPPGELRSAVDALAGLTAVDGATVIDHGFRLLAFGAKIARRKGGAPLERVLLSEPIEGSVNVAIDPALLGGTRHFAAAQFVQDQQQGIALVASQDGRFTVFAWSPVHDMVHAHRMETLLL